MRPPFAGCPGPLRPQCPNPPPASAPVPRFYAGRAGDSQSAKDHTPRALPGEQARVACGVAVRQLRRRASASVGRHTVSQAAVALQSPGFSQAFCASLLACCVRWPSSLLRGPSWTRITLQRLRCGRRTFSTQSRAFGLSGRPSTSQVGCRPVASLQRPHTPATPQLSCFKPTSISYVLLDQSAPERLPLGMYALTKAELTARMRHVRLDQGGAHRSHGRRRISVRRRQRRSSSSVRGVRVLRR